MRRASKRAPDHAERGTESAQQRPPKRKSSSPEEKSLHEKLYDMYVEEYGKEPEGTEELTRDVNLLEKLVLRESLPRLLVSLFPGERYSLVLKVETKVYSEFVIVPYEDRDFLEYLDTEQLAPDVVDVLERAQVDIFQSGCVITEVRDYRQCTNGDRSRYQSRHVLLRPAMQTSASDVHTIASNNQTCAQEDRLSLESQPVLAAAEPLCPGPSASVACSEQKLLCDDQKMNTPPMRGNLQEDYSAAPLNPQQELPCGPPPPELGAWAPDQQSQESQADQQDDLEIFDENSLDLWKQLALALKVPFDFDIEKFAENWPFQYDDADSIIWPDSEAEDDPLFGCEGDDPSQTTKPPVMQSQNDPFISGERSPKKVRRRRKTRRPYCYTDDHSYCLMPGSKTGAGKATGESKKSGKKRERCAVRVAQASCGSASLIQLSPGRAAEEPLAATVESAVQGQGGQPAPPVIPIPCSSGNSSLGKPFTSQQASRIRIWQLPSPAPASEPPSLAQKPVVEVRRVRTLPTATVTSASTSQATPVIQVKASEPPSLAQKPVVEVRRVRTLPTATVTSASTSQATPVIQVKASEPPSLAQKPVVEVRRVRTLPTATVTSASTSQATPVIQVKASEPPSLAQKPVVEVRRVRTLPTATVTSASTSQATPVIQVKASCDDPKVVRLVGPLRIVRTVVRAYNPTQGSPHRARAPSGVKPSSLPSGGQPKNAGPAAPQAPSAGGVQYVLGNLSSLRPVRVLWVPQGSDISAILQQAQQQRQVLYPLIPLPLQQQPPTSQLPQPVAQVSSVQGSSGQQRGLSTPQAAAINLNGVGSVQQSQRVELSQPGHRPSQVQVRVQLPAAFQKLPQSQWRIVRLPEAVAAASVQPAQPGGGQQAAGQAKGPENGGLPSTPKC